MLSVQVLKGADFATALAHHRDRLHTEAEHCIPFSSGDALEELNAIYSQIAERSIQLGHARYANSARTAWRYTLRGTFVFAIATFRSDRALGVVRWKKSSPSPSESASD